MHLKTSRNWNAYIDHSNDFFNEGVVDMNGKVYVVTHKKYKLNSNLKEKGYALISVGKGKEVSNDGFNDNTGDNISSKNPNYCELTALYWIWKNDTVSQYKGLCHYRRYITTKWLSNDMEYSIDSRTIEKTLKKYDIILPQKQHFIRSAQENYLRCGRPKDLKNLRYIISKKYPDYIEAYDLVMNSNSSYLMNMMITSTECFNSYCKWLFDILFQLEQITDLTGYSQQEARIYGYMSERLLTVWVLKNKLKVKEFPFINTEEKDGLIKRMSQVLHIYQRTKDLIYMVKST